MRVTRDEFDDLRRKHDGMLSEVTVKFADGSEYTLQACQQGTNDADGLFLFIEQEDGIIALGGGSTFMLEILYEKMLPNMIDGWGRKKMG